MVIAAERTSEQRSDQDRVDEEVKTQITQTCWAAYSCNSIRPLTSGFVFLYQVFKKAYIPRTLTEVSHYERDVDLMRTKEEESAISGHNDNVRTSGW